MKKYICYYRVSTKKQGLGLEAQKAICEKFASAEGSEILAEYSEKESGKEYLEHRQELKNALNACKALGASLLVAKVDRLTRDLADGATLTKQYDIVFCDHPEMDSIQQGIFFGLAQKEREMISQRTKQALQAKKAQGVKLGRPGATFSAEIREKATEAKRQSIISNPANKRAYLVITKMKGMSNREIADTLNDCGFTTAKGGKFYPETVKRLRTAFETIKGKEL